MWSLLGLTVVSWTKLSLSSSMFPLWRAPEALVLPFLVVFLALSRAGSNVRLFMSLTGLVVFTISKTFTWVGCKSVTERYPPAPNPNRYGLALKYLFTVSVASDTLAPVSTRVFTDSLTDTVLASLGMFSVRFRDSTIFTSIDVDSPSAG